MRFLIVLLIAVLSFYSCKNQKSYSDFTVGHSDDFSNKDVYSEQSMWLRELENSKENSKLIKLIKLTKIYYKDSVYSYDDFVKNIGWSNVTPVRIIRDSVQIDSYTIENCKTLIVVEP